MGRRIRSLKPEWLADEQLLAAGSDARVLSIALILQSDDYGRGRFIIPVVAGEVFGLDDNPVHTLLTALDRLHPWYVTLYEVRGQRYFAVNNWKRHQRVDKPGKPQVPSPDDADAREIAPPKPSGTFARASGAAPAAAASAPPTPEPAPVFVTVPAPPADGTPAMITGPYGPEVNVRGTLAKVPETLATDQDQDQDREEEDDLARAGAGAREAWVDVVVDAHVVYREFAAAADSHDWPLHTYLRDWEALAAMANAEGGQDALGFLRKVLQSYWAAGGFADTHRTVLRPASLIKNWRATVTEAFGGRVARALSTAGEESPEAARRERLMRIRSSWAAGYELGEAEAIAAVERIDRELERLNERLSEGST